MLSVEQTRASSHKHGTRRAFVCRTSHGRTIGRCPGAGVERVGAGWLGEWTGRKGGGGGSRRRGDNITLALQPLYVTAFGQ